MFPRLYLAWINGGINIWRRRFHCPKRWADHNVSEKQTTPRVDQWKKLCVVRHQTQKRNLLKNLLHKESYINNHREVFISLLCEKAYHININFMGLRKRKKKVKFSRCLTNWALHHEGVWWTGCIDLHFVNPVTSWRWVVSSTPRPLYPRGKWPRYPLDRRMGGPHNRPGRRGEEKSIDPTGTRTATRLSPNP
jgi:hypothetical protein